MQPLLWPNIAPRFTEFDGSVNLIRHLRQGRRIADIIGGQTGANDVATDEIQTRVQLAPGAPFTPGFMLRPLPFAFAGNL